MFANASPTRSLKSSLYYDRALRNPEKGGKVIMANGVGLYMTPTAQLAMMEAYSNQKFKVKAYSVIISHSDEDNGRLKDDPKFQELLLHEFVNACKRRKIDLDNIPYIIPEHVNTDNLHYHMLMLINHFDGTRINTQFIGKRLALAAVDVSKKYGLHYPEGWDVRDRKKLEYQEAGLDNPKPAVAQCEGKPQDEMANPAVTVGLDEEKERKLNNRIRRYKAVQEARRRKEDEARRKKQAERGFKEGIQVQKQKAVGREKDGQGYDKPEAKRERKPRRPR